MVSAAISPWRNRTQRPSFTSIAGMINTVLLPSCSEWKFLQDPINTVPRQLFGCHEHPPPLEKPEKVFDHGSLPFVIVTDPEDLPICRHGFHLKSHGRGRICTKSAPDSLLVHQDLPNQSSIGLERLCHRCRGRLRRSLCR